MTRRMSAGVFGIVLFIAAPVARAAYSPATTNGWFVFGGHVAGANQSLFRMDVWLFNPDSANNVTATLIFHPSVASGVPTQPSVSSGQIVLFPRETKFFPDVTFSTVPAGEGNVGALEWQSNGNLMGGARVYTISLTSPATFGFFVPAIPVTESMTAKTSTTDSSNVLQIFGVNSGDPNFRIALDVANTSGVTLPIEVRVIDPADASVYGGVQNFNLAARSLLRLGNILQTVSAPLKAGLRVTVAVKEGSAIPSGGVLAVVTTLDNTTNDGFAFVGQRQSGSVVPAEMLPIEEVP